MRITEISYNETIRGKNGISFTAKAEITEVDDKDAVVKTLKAFVKKSLQE